MLTTMENSRHSTFASQQQRRPLLRGGHTCVAIKSAAAIGDAWCTTTEERVTPPQGIFLSSTRSSICVCVFFFFLCVRVQQHTDIFLTAAPEARTSLGSSYSCTGTQEVGSALFSVFYPGEQTKNRVATARFFSRVLHRCCLSTPRFLDALLEFHPSILTRTPRVSCRLLTAVPFIECVRARALIR